MARTLALLLAMALTACISVRSAGETGQAPATAPVPIPGLDASGEVNVYLETLRSLIEGDAVAQADVFREVSAAADAQPTTTNRLMLALALATPTHPANNAAEAQRLLGDLLASGDALLPEEHVLALIHLKDVEQRLILNAEADRLQRDAAAAAAQRNDRSSQELAAALEENRQLKAALDEARARLDAITNIERSIRERENDSDP